MHKMITHNRCSASFKVFQTEVLTFLRTTVPTRWETFCDSVTDHFRAFARLPR